MRQLMPRTNYKKMKRNIKKLLEKRPRLRKPEPESRLNQAIENLPRITNETVAEHREELLSSARKYIYPLKHTKRRVIMVTSSIVVGAVVVFFAYVGLALYKFQSSSTFLYYVTQVIPLPVAKAGSSWVSYENYLFELRHYTHYYETQQQLDFNSDTGRRQLDAFRKQALQEVVDAAYVKQLATKYHVSVSGMEVNNEVQLLRQQNRLGSSDQEFADVLKEFWGWSVDDFKRELKQQLLAQKVVATLDTNTQQRAQTVLTQLHHGGDFAKLAAQYSDDVSTKGSGGVYASVIDKSDRDVSPQIVNELFALKPGQTSGIINTGYTLEIVKVISSDGGKIRAAHISFTFQDISTYLQPLQDHAQPHLFIHPA